MLVLYRVLHFTLGVGKPWHWFATWMVVDLMPVWTDLRERCAASPPTGDVASCQ